MDIIDSKYIGLVSSRLQKFKERNVGRGSIIPEPEFNFKKPVFRKKLDLPRASEIPIAKAVSYTHLTLPTRFSV